MMEIEYYHIILFSYFPYYIFLLLLSVIEEEISKLNYQIRVKGEKISNQ